MKKLLAIPLAAVLALIGCLSASAAMDYRYGDWLLSLQTDGGYSFTVKSYEGESDSATVPKSYGGYPVTAVSPYAFAANTTLRSVHMNENITSIGSNAFLSAKNLEEVILPAGLTEIGESVFSDTPSLKSVNLQDTAVTEIPAKAFLNSGIEKLTVPAAVTKIGENAFSGCNDLTVYVYPGSAMQEYAKTHGMNYVTVITYLLGDANTDGIVNINDVTTIQRHLAELERLKGTNLLAADANQDGMADIADATVIQMYLAEYEMEYPIGEVITQ